MRAWLRKWWPALKALLMLAILVAIGWRFWQDLQYPEIWQRSFHAGWVVLSGVLYLLGLGTSAWFWYRLLRVFEQRPTVSNTIRAYYLGHLGKYVPGKALALLLRSTLAAGPGVRVGVAGLTSFYEVLTTMTSGALLGVILLAAFGPDRAVQLDWDVFTRLFNQETAKTVILDRKLLALLALVLLGPLVVPILPGFFNRVVGKVVERFRDRDAPPLARVPTSAFLEGLAITAVNWLLWGLSLWAMFLAVGKEPLAWDWQLWLRWSGLLAVAYVAGFMLPVPGGLGVREFFLTLFLVPELTTLNLGEHDPAAFVALVVVLLRLAWTAAELVMAAGVWWLPSSCPRSAWARTLGRSASRAGGDEPSARDAERPDVRAHAERGHEEVS